MSAAKSSHCFVCTEFGSHRASGGKGSAVLSRQLEVIFVLCKVLEVPQDKVACYLQEFPAVEEWVRVCEQCGEVVKRCWGIWKELKGTQRRFQECQQELIGMIREKGGVEEGDAGVAEGGRIFRECRQFANEHEYSKPFNPFIEGDLIAREKVVRGVVKTEPQEEENADCEWTPEGNESAFSDESIADDNISENEDNYKSVSKPAEPLKLKSEEDKDCEWTPGVNDRQSSDDEVSEATREPVQTTTKVLKLKSGGQKPCLVATCWRKFGDWNKLSKHLTTKHTAEERQNGWKLACLHCPVLFTSYKSLQNHTVKVHKLSGTRRKTPLKTHYVMETCDGVNHRETESTGVSSDDDGTLNEEISEREEETSSGEEESDNGAIGRHYTLKRCLVRSCSRKFRGWNKLTKHVIGKHTEEERQNGWKLACLYCPVLFTNYKSLQSHTVKVHKLDWASRKTPLGTRYVLEAKTENGKTYILKESDDNEDDKDSKMKFVKSEENENKREKGRSGRKPGQELKSCLVRSCSRKFSNWYSLDRHLTSEHSKEERQQNIWKLACLQCSDLFRTYGALKRHTIKVHNGGIGKCHGTTKTRYVEVESEKIKEREEKIVKMIKPSLTCPFCKRFRCRVSNPSKTCRHLERCRKQSNVIADLHCPTCKVFSCAGDNPAEFANHTMSCGVNTKVSVANRLFHCKICSGDASWTGKVFFKLKFFLEHYFLHQQLRLECTECREKLKNINHSHYHWQKEHVNLLLTRGTFVPSQCYRQLEPHPLPEVYWWCSECGAQFLSQDARDQHLNQEHPDQIKVEKMEHCSFCEKQYACPDELKLHQLTTHVVEMGKLIPCHLCGDPQLFLNTEQVLIHRRLFHKHEVLKCQQCVKEFLDTDQLSEHMANCAKTDLEQKCSTCNKVFASRSNLKLHIAAVHERKEQTPCHVCGKNFMHQVSLQLHLFKAHQIGSPKLRQCSEPGCQEAFPLLRDLREHVIKCHGGQRQYHKCSYCGRDFPTTGTLKRHERLLHQPDDPSQWISCDLCPFKSRTKEHVKTHREKVHDPQNPRVYYIPCSVCGTILRTKKNLVEHMRKEHKDAKVVRTRARKKTKAPKTPKPKVDKPLKPCPVPNCPEIFPTVKARMDHLKTAHTNQERHEALRVPCSECGKMFAGAQSLRFHKAEVHSQSAEQSCVCDVCGKSYSRYSMLYQHKKRRWQCQRLQLTEEQVVAVCEICGLRSRNKFALAEHVRNRHKKKTKEKTRETFRCLEEGCEKVFMKRKSLEYHITGVHKKGEPEFGCKLCAKRYYNPRALSQHVNWVHKGRRYYAKSQQKKPVSTESI